MRAAAPTSMGRLVVGLGGVAGMGLGLLLAVGCSSGSSSPGELRLGPSFTLAESPASLSIPAGGGGYVTVTVSRHGGFTGAVTLSLEGAPAGVVASGTVPAEGQTGQLALQIDRDVAPQNLEGIRLKGVSDGRTQTAPFLLAVAPPLPVGRIGSDLVQASGGPQRGASLENTPVVQEPVRSTVSKDATEHSQIRHGFEPSASGH